MFPDPHKQLTKAEESAIVVNTFAVGFLVAFILWMALDWSEFERITTIQAYWNEIFTGIENAFPGGVLACVALWLYQVSQDS